MKFGILTVSDTCYKKENIDKSGPELKKLIKEKYSNSEVVFQDIVPDEFYQIKIKLEEWSDKMCDVILTTGGTGIAERDVTPEATKAIIEKEVPGIIIAMMNKSLTATPFAMLSRALCGIRKQTLVINFPGSVKAVIENFSAIADVIPHAVTLLQNKSKDIEMFHKRLQNPDNLSPSKVRINIVDRSRKSPYPMVEVNDAIELIKANCEKTLLYEFIAVDESLGRILAENVRSNDPLPPFPASIKDGYAVIASDGCGNRIVDDMKAAGDNPDSKELKSGKCVRISTGAPVPPGADAVVQIEDTTLVITSNLHEVVINIEVAPKIGQDIRPIGSDIPANTIVLQKQSVLNAPEIGLLAAVGQLKVNVFKRLKVGVISTGNEVQDPNNPLKPGQIRDSNKITLINLLKQYSYSAEDFGRTRDEPTIVKHTIAKAFEKCDLVITTGGVSMGEFDVIKQVLVEDFGATIHFGRVNMKPGKPTTFASCMYKDKKKIFFGLPGNPVSATVTCLLFVIPTLRHFENKPNILFPQIHVTPNFKPVFDFERPDYQRVKLVFGDKIVAETTGNQISSKLNSFVEADGIMLVEPYKLKLGESRENCSYYSENKTYLCYLLNKY